MSEIEYHLSAAGRLASTAEYALGEYLDQRVAAIDLLDRGIQHLNQAYSLLNGETSPRTVPCQEAGALPNEAQKLREIRKEIKQLAGKTYTRGISTTDENVADMDTVIEYVEKIQSYIEVGIGVYNDGDYIRNERRLRDIKTDAGIN
ncbi:hypothetical protein K0C01_09330 [Salinarchaeum sp. IM2453]|uniref:hypothetical protein n=1 Tax=Salinarchaeum sp. IM2453 TaxID=2862870 RepID=UPI001C82CF0C|nr:hypothetical protein [Salinarchaeum sp. IM2453]QZA87995.1 hypothetical protein K0C01_09330 [Salinarchaeum sp. IM2453]